MANTKNFHWPHWTDWIGILGFAGLILAAFICVVPMTLLVAITVYAVASGVLCFWLNYNGWLKDRTGLEYAEYDPQVKQHE